MHFCYGLGAFVSPMIAEPFLLNEDCSLLIDNSTRTSGGGSPLMDADIMESNESLPADTLEDAQEMTRVRYAFWIMCALQVGFQLIKNSWIQMVIWITTKIKSSVPRTIVDISSNFHQNLLITLELPCKQTGKQTDKHRQTQIYLHQGGYVIIRFCLFVSKIKKTYCTDLHQIFTVYGF